MVCDRASSDTLQALSVLVLSGLATMLLSGVIWPSVYLWCSHWDSQVCRSVELMWEGSLATQMPNCSHGRQMCCHHSSQVHIGRFLVLHPAFGCHAHAISERNQSQSSQASCCNWSISFCCDALSCMQLVSARYILPLLQRSCALGDSAP